MKTAEGKEISSLNALTHGMTSRRLFLPSEDQAGFLTLLKDVTKHYSPANEQQNQLANRVAECLWIARRTDLQFELFYQTRIQAIMKQHPEEAPNADLAAIFLQTNETESRTYAKMHRYRRAAQNDYYRAVKALDKLQKDRRATEKEAWRNSARFVEQVSDDELSTFSAPKAPAPKPGIENLSRQQRRALARAEAKAAFRASRSAA